MKTFLLLLFSINFAYAQKTSTFFIHFDFDRSAITPTASRTLDSIFNISSIQRIELYGHCDHVGDHAYNDALSMRRVNETMNYLVQKGINENIIAKFEGFGKRRPLNDNETAEERLQNRRVEIIIHWSVQDTPTPIAQEKKPAPTLTEILRDTTRIGQNIILRNLQFQPGRHFLLPESQPTLDTLYQIMAGNPTLVIEIQGHVCCTPDDVDGLDIDLRTYDLSQQRAKAVYEHLISRNIPRQRMSYRGFGGSRKLYPYERNDFERQENRRVELRIVRR